MTLQDLSNPDGYTAILHNSGGFIQRGDNQGFQFLPHWVELWQMLDDGQLLQVKRWRRKSIIAYYGY